MTTQGNYVTDLLLKLTKILPNREQRGTLVQADQTNFETEEKQKTITYRAYFQYFTLTEQ